ncbi:MAG: DUF1648 domain-containing protein [Deltaproteobacteria bacterium]|nr:DUF1648 domain-containing protein [Deltaproteobacteria bacterium]
MNVERRPVFFSAWDWLAAVGLASLAVFYTQVLARLPDPVPTHFNAIGVADGWTPKAELHWIIFGVPVIAWSLLFVIGVIASMIPSDPRKARIAAMHPLRDLTVMGASILMGSCLAIPFFGLWVLYAGIAAVFVALALAVLFTAFETKKFLARLPDAANYRRGIFYVNPADPRLWVEKQCGVGMTLNYARPAAKWISLLFIVIVLIVLVFAFRLK